MSTIDINSKYPGTFYIQVEKDTNHCMLTVVAGYEEGTIWLDKEQVGMLIIALKDLEAILDD